LSYLEKPSKARRRKQEKKIKETAKEYRQEQRTLAIFRDDGFCTACYFLDGRRQKAQDVHHVYGRAITKNVPTDKKEHFSSLLCLCREHHNQIGIIRRAGSGKYSWVEDVLEKANTTPINKEFNL
jgi:hypothetical protein